MRLLTAQQTAEILQVGYRTVLNLIKKGKLPYVKLEGRRSWLVDEADVVTLVEESKVRPNSDLTDLTTHYQTQQNTTRSKKVQNRKTVVKANWYKQIARVD